jgi:hypothetical protein
MPASSRSLLERIRAALPPADDLAGVLIVIPMLGLPYIAFLCLAFGLFRILDLL